MGRILPKLTLLMDHVGDDASLFAKSIMTTDTFPKIVVKRAGDACVLGIAKGAGMIAPDMATTLAIVLTDAIISKQDLDNIIKYSIEETFNAVTIDGDTSTNDTLIALASGLVPAELSEVKTAVFETIRELALMIVSDGEGATKMVKISVAGASNNQDAKTVAMTVANSLLVKTAIFGADPNWGRIAAAAGYSGIEFDPEDLSITIQGLDVVAKGKQTETFNEDELHHALLKKDVAIRISLGNGSGEFTAWTTDLSYRYVEINSQYRT
jgi:glutamate N-acetyltransferase/amino-acid N-acetyltransferase